jgi:hypothetical protein
MVKAGSTLRRAVSHLEGASTFMALGVTDAVAFDRSAGLA